MRPVTIRFPKFSRLQVLVHLVFWVLAAWLAIDAVSGNLTVNPIQAATQRTGKFALIFLVASLACTPLNTLFGWRQALTARRPLGLYAFFWAGLHFAIFIWIDYGFAWEFIRIEILEKRFILVGAAALTILALLAATSSKYAMRRLGKRWKQLHRLVFFAAPLVVLHYTWAKKGDLLRLSGDIVQPMVFGLVVVLLLLARLPSVRRTAVSARTRLKQRLFPSTS